MFQRDVQLRFDGVRGSVPEFSNVAVDPQSTLPNTDTLVRFKAIKLTVGLYASKFLLFYTHLLVFYLFFTDIMV